LNGYRPVVNVKDFAIVQPGEVLFQIDDRIYNPRVHQVQATLAMKEAALRNILQQRTSADATIAKNEAALQNARAQNLKIQA
ncbi:biotin/lipoyl-binding protein, partial [Klebsiella pneumoniae]|nr:biotin/lipoyl-binding protein [Klebsiella pneumoniae]